MDSLKRQSAISQHSMMSDTGSSLTDNVNELKRKSEALERLKREQKLVKEQLSRLQMERKTADKDLEVLSRNSSTCSSSSSSANEKHEELRGSGDANRQNEKPTNDRNNAAIKNLSSLKGNSPNLSPISPQNVFQDTRN